MITLSVGLNQPERVSSSCQCAVVCIIVSHIYIAAAVAAVAGLQYCFSGVTGLSHSSGCFLANAADQEQAD